ncbi:MAG: YceI family protein [Chitinophagia bacterium]|nr:YceI family protein [Chitinophagia bacterium]
MKKIVLSLFILAALNTQVNAQKYMSRTGKVVFDATSPKSPEKIEGINNETASLLNSASGEFVFQVPVKSFKMEKELMQQHFNENYMQSDKFPKAEFKGKIENLAAVNFTKDGSYTVAVVGNLTIHGETQKIAIPGMLTVKGSEITAKAKFPVKLADYKIDIPGVVADKIAKEANIMIDVLLNKK